MLLNSSRQVVVRREAPDTHPGGRCLTCHTNSCKGLPERYAPNGRPFPWEPPPSEAGGTHTSRRRGREGTTSTLGCCTPRAVPPPIRAPDRLATKVRANPDFIPL